MKVACHFDPDSRRSRHLADAFARGVEVSGDEAVRVKGFAPFLKADCGVAYGWRRPEMFAAYNAAGKPFIYLDLGWWNRKPALRVLDGYHKVMVDSRDDVPAYARAAKADRAKLLKLTPAPWRASGKHILIAGMSAKSARTRGFEAGQWERRVVEQLRRVTQRPLVYRPKPSDPHPRAIAGTRLSGPSEPLERVLKDCHAVVTLHSNVAVDALLAGVPVHAEAGACVGFSTPLAEIETPRLPDGREQLIADLATAQWNVDEMRAGACWRAVRPSLLKDEQA